MKFSDFDLYRAIHSVYLQFEKEDKKPRSADWFIYKSKRKLLINMVITNIVGFCGNLYGEEEILKAWDDFGKNKEKYKLIVETALLNGCECQRSSPDEICSSTVSIEKVNSSKQLSSNNCIIVCKKHNSDFSIIKKTKQVLIHI